MIDEEELPSLTAIDGKLDRCCLRPGDIVLSKIGTPFKAALAPSSLTRRVLVNGNFFIIRVNEKADPYYVKAFLESELGQTILTRIAAGSVMPNLSVRSISEMRISLPDMACQQRVAARYRARAEKVAALQKQLDDALEALGHVLESESCTTL